MKRIGIYYDSLRPGRGTHGTHLAFTGLPDVELVLADPNPEPPYLDKIGAARRYSTFDEMLAKEDISALVLGSRLPEDHYDPMKKALSRGIHVFCEKPVSSELSELDELTALANRNHCLVAPAHLARYSRAFRTFKRCLDSGMIGTPLTFYGRGKEDERGGGEDLLVLGTHILDIGCMLFGKPESLTAEVWQNGRPLRKGDTLPTEEPMGLVAGDDLSVRLRFPGGVNGFFESRRDVYDGKEVRMGVTVVGTKGTLSVHYDNQRIVRFSKTRCFPGDDAVWETIPSDPLPEIPGAAPLHNEWFCMWYFAEGNREAARNLLAAMDGREELSCRIEDARDTQEIINAIYLSELEQRRIHFPLTNRNNPLR